MTNAELALINGIKEKQGNTPDGIFAENILKIPRTTWNQHKNLSRPVGLTLVAATAKNFPDLKPLIWNFLLDGSK